MSSADDVCPATETLCGWVEGRLEEGDRALLEHHLDTCAACRRAVAEVGRVLGAADADTPDARSPSRAPSAPPGSAAASGAPRIGRYEIRREIGMGGMGVVYEGFDPSLGRRVALKVLRPDKSAADRRGLTERLAAEARALAKISHPNVLTVFDVGVDGDTVFLAAELIDGVNMDAGWPHRARGWRDRLEAYLQAARGLAAIHAAGITHRDIKPSNILLGHDGRVRITDFGLAVGLDEKAAPAGTPAYMAPEQLAGTVSPRADQFSLAVCMVEAINGARPALGSTALDLAAKGRSVWGASGPPQAVWEVLARALQPKDADRFETVEVFADALETSIAGPASRAAPRSKAAPDRRAGGNATGYAALAIAVVAGGIATASALRQPPAPAATSAPTDDAMVMAPPATVVASAPATSPGVTGAADVPSGAAESSSPPSAGRPASPSAPSGGASAPAAAPAASIDPNDPLAGMKRGIMLSEMVRDATNALSARDGKKCLAKLDEIVAIEPSNASSLELYRGQCEMLVGRCAEGARRIKASGSLGANADQLAEMYRGMYCPVSSTASAKEQVKSIWLQAGAAGTAEKCAAYEAQLEKALAASKGEKVDASAVTGAWSAIGSCWVGVGDCTRARAAALRFIGPERIDDYMENWIGGVKAERCKR